MARRSTTFRSKGAKPRYLWTSVLLSNFATATTVTGVNIIEPADWERGPTSFERATLVRVRGWLSTRISSEAADALFMYIGLYDEDEVSSLADVVATYDSEDILWTGGTVRSSTGNLSGNAVSHQHIDVKVARKITSAQELRLVFTTTFTTTLVVSGVLRACIKYT